MRSCWQMELTRTYMHKRSRTCAHCRDESEHGLQRMCQTKLQHNPPEELKHMTHQNKTIQRPQDKATNFRKHGCTVPKDTSQRHGQETAWAPIRSVLSMSMMQSMGASTALNPTHPTNKHVNVWLDGVGVVSVHAILCARQTHVRSTCACACVYAQAMHDVPCKGWLHHYT
jgi:hypothetical protein